ncbi:RNA-dependent ATPase [Endocarpon pusillum]|uniref:RNA helicase n=1 Tax=Endocarpon pusillum TaxID=364733 RepID=A0A8H7A891_9EURO|nr:RNA-dependent ATPase [Endocarpon pusillum]
MGKRMRDDGQLTKEERRRLKKSRKKAISIEDITPSSTDVTHTPNSEAQDDSASYTQHPGLNTLPQTEIDNFLKSDAIQVADPQTSGLRPITSFSFLPPSFASDFSSIFKTFSAPSSIQASAWPFLLSHRDVVGIAETGSGKTLAFGLPLVVSLSGLKKKKGVRAVVIAPTRELAIQVFEQIETLTKVASSSLKAVCIYGGMSKEDQRRSLSSANIIVATPGRLKDFMSDGSANLSKVKYLVLDEADRMLDKGFEDDIKEIVGKMPSSKKRQTAMFTATWPKNIRELAATFMTEPVRITIGRTDTEDSGELRANTRIKQSVEVVEQHEKEGRLLQLLNQFQKGDKEKDRVLVFCLYKKEALRIERFIRSRGFRVAAIHGDMSQRDRIASLEAFKKAEVSLLVATDVAARGLDIPNVKAVINVTFPLTAEDYVHRIGRTGRAGADGISVTLFTEQDKGLAGGLINVLKAANQEVPEALLRFGTTVKKKQHEAYGAFFKESEEGKTATKIKFDD